MIKMMYTSPEFKDLFSNLFGCEFSEKKSERKEEKNTIEIDLPGVEKTSIKISPFVYGYIVSASKKNGKVISLEIYDKREIEDTATYEDGVLTLKVKTPKIQTIKIV